MYRSSPRMATKTNQILLNSISLYLFPWHEFGNACMTIYCIAFLGCVILYFLKPIFFYLHLVSRTIISWSLVKTCFGANEVAESYCCNSVTVFFQLLERNHPFIEISGFDDLELIEKDFLRSAIFQCFLGQEVAISYSCNLVKIFFWLNWSQY